jgi:hypothetical protein
MQLKSAFTNSAKPFNLPLVQSSSAGESDIPDPSPDILRVNDRTLTALDLLLILAQQRLMPSLVQSIIIDEAIAPFQPNLEEQTIAYQQLRQQYQLDSESDYFAWLGYQGLNSRQFYHLAIRAWQIEQFKWKKWGTILKSYFMDRKSQLDRVVYSLIRTSNQEKALELYYRIKEGENSLTEIASQHSEGDEVYTNGLIGPVEIIQIHPVIAQKLQSSQLGQLCMPIQIDEWSVIVRLEHFLPAQLNSMMEQRLLNELFEKWMSEKIQQTQLSFL